MRFSNIALSLTAVATAGALLLLPTPSPASDGLATVQPPPGAEWSRCLPSGQDHLRCEYRVPVAESLTPAGLDCRARDLARGWSDRLTGQGWTVAEEKPVHRGLTVILRKDTIQRVVISAVSARRPAGGAMVPFIRAVSEQERLIPLRDRPGIDPPRVPRYPGSVRVRWMCVAGQYSARYLTAAAIDRIRAFYQKELAAAGWQQTVGGGDLNYTGGLLPSSEQPAYRLTIRLEREQGIGVIGLALETSDRSPVSLPAESLTPESAPRCPDRTILVDPADLQPLPVYPGLTALSGDVKLDPISGEEVHTRSFRLEDSPMKTALEMAGYYRRSMQNDGWNLLDEEWYGIGRTLSFIRRGVRTTIRIQAVGRYPLPEKKPRITIPLKTVIRFPIPSAGIPGEDIPAVPRYPGSVRIYHLKAASDHLVRYKAPGCLDKAERFFIRRLMRKGWRFCGYDRTGLLFIPGDGLTESRPEIPAGGIVPTTLKVKVDDHHDGSVKIGLDLTRGDA